MSALQGAELEVYVPPTIHYGRDGGGDTELFAIPITIANDGARSGTVISMELEVQNLKTNTTKRYYSAFLGEHPREADAPQSPVRAAQHCRPRGVHARRCASIRPAMRCRSSSTAKGEYAFRLQLNTASPPEPSLLDRLSGRTQPRPSPSR